MGMGQLATPSESDAREPKLFSWTFTLATCVTLLAACCPLLARSTTHAITHTLQLLEDETIMYSAIADEYLIEAKCPTATTANKEIYI